MSLGLVLNEYLMHRRVKEHVGTISTSHERRHDTGLTETLETREKKSRSTKFRCARWMWFRLGWWPRQQVSWLAAIEPGKTVQDKISTKPTTALHSRGLCHPTLSGKFQTIPNLRLLSDSRPCVSWSKHQSCEAQSSFHTQSQ